ncbi:MAG: alpha/beta hydrolase [Alphaproteobacteria bacterium]
MAWLALGALGAVVAALFGAWQYAHATNSVALLDLADRVLSGTGGSKPLTSAARYGPDPSQQIDVIAPRGPGPHPVLVFIHGGGWHSGAPGEYAFIGRHFARAGYLVVLAGYRLGDAGRFPAMLEDSAAALGWVKRNVAPLGGNPNKVFVMGHSAGAYNAVMLALDGQWLDRAGVGQGFIKGVVGLSGPYDFYPFTSDSARNAFGHVADPRITQPINHVRADAPPMLLLTGDADETVKMRNSKALAAALTAAGQPTGVVVLPGVDHAGPVLKLAAPFNRDRRVIDPVLQFLTAHGGASGAVQTKNL